MAASWSATTRARAGWMQVKPGKAGKATAARHHSTTASQSSLRPCDTIVWSRRAGSAASPWADLRAHSSSSSKTSWHSTSSGRARSFWSRFASSSRISGVQSSPSRAWHLHAPATHHSSCHRHFSSSSTCCLADTEESEGDREGEGNQESDDDLDSEDDQESKDYRDILRVPHLQVRRPGPCCLPVQACCLCGVAASSWNTPLPHSIHTPQLAGAASPLCQHAVHLCCLPVLAPRAPPPLHRLQV